VSQDPPIDPLTGERFRGFNALLGFRMAEWRNDYARLEVTIEAQHLNRSGVVHGGVLATILDATLGYAGIHPAEPGGKPRRAVTLTLTTSYVGQAKTGIVTCIAERRGGGRSVFMAAGEVRDAAGALLAFGEGTYRYVAETPR
jgi:uncharacterized protein (TIGR00369 family)